MEEIIAYQKQEVHDNCSVEDSIAMLQQIFDDGFAL
jgi:hypothetical protein